MVALLLLQQLLLLLCIVAVVWAFTECVIYIACLYISIYLYTVLYIYKEKEDYYYCAAACSAPWMFEIGKGAERCFAYAEDAGTFAFRYIGSFLVVLVGGWWLRWCMVVFSVDNVIAWVPKDGIKQDSLINGRASSTFGRRVIIVATVATSRAPSPFCPVQAYDIYYFCWKLKPKSHRALDVHFYIKIYVMHMLSCLLLI